MEYYNSQCLLYNLVRENNLLKSQINKLNDIINNNINKNNNDIISSQISDIITDNITEDNKNSVASGNAVVNYINDKNINNLNYYNSSNDTWALTIYNLYIPLCYSDENYECKISLITLATGQPQTYIDMIYNSNSNDMSYITVFNSNNGINISLVTILKNDKKLVCLKIFTNNLATNYTIYSYKNILTYKDLPTDISDEQELYVNIMKIQSTRS